MILGRRKALLRTFVETYPALRWALIIQDVICYLISGIRHCCWLAVKCSTKPFVILSRKLDRCLRHQLEGFPVFGSRARYKRLQQRQLKAYRGPIPYGDDPVRRTLTYHVGLLLGLLLYLFVYFVLIKHHSITSIAVASILLLAYMVILENSHNLRSILMLCLPIMFTNRGRALIFCSMLTILVVGPIKNSQENINQLHVSLNCCQQYLLIKADNYVDENVVKRIVKVEDAIYELIADLKEYVKEMQAKIESIIDLAQSIERYISAAIKELMDIINVCNSRGQELYLNCTANFQHAYFDCRSKLGKKLFALCEVIRPVASTCEFNKLPEVLCQIPRSVVRYIEMTVGARLEHYVKTIANEFRVDVDINHTYAFKRNESKSFKRVALDISFDIERKFWYVYLVSRVFNLVSLILVIWITVSATMYHLHFLNDVKYDNIYLDQYLHDIEKSRRRSLGANRNDSQYLGNSKKEDKLIHDEISSDDEELRSLPEKHFLFPMKPNHERLYFKPFSAWMNEAEKSKLCIASIVWLVIVGYISFFTLVDFALHELLSQINSILRDILFKSDLPLLDITSSVGNHTVVYNRTYLNELSSVRKRAHLEDPHLIRNRTGGLGSMYRRLMESIEKNIPDDMAILNSLELCLPNPSKPNYSDYRSLLYLAVITFFAVILEAYMLRTRHCIANLFYPARAKKRALWLYSKLLAEKSKIDAVGELELPERKSWFELGWLKLLEMRNKR